jgi:formyltetrahydrofolate-dependent phosphoribosylglycinamide formyltransferase
VKKIGGATGEPGRPLRLGVLFSGGGRTLENIAGGIARGDLAATIPLAISSHAQAGGIARCERLGIPCEILDYRELGERFQEALLQTIAANDIDLVLLAGFIRPFPIGPEYEGRVLNIHPALLPSFGGRGFYGHHVHEAVLASGARFSGCTVHFVTAEYDSGPIVVQRIVPVEDDDTPDTLAARVFDEECLAYPEAIRLFAAGRLRMEKGRVRILPRQD